MSRREPAPDPTARELEARRLRRRQLALELLLAFGPVVAIAAGTWALLGWPAAAIVAGGLVWWDDRAGQRDGAATTHQDGREG